MTKYTNVEVLDRLKKLINVTTEVDLAKHLNMPVSTIKSWKAGNKITLDKIFKAIPNINFQWLFYGEGEPYIETKKKDNIVASDIEPYLKELKAELKFEVRYLQDMFVKYIAKKPIDEPQENRESE